MWARWDHAVSCTTFTAALWSLILLALEVQVNHFGRQGKITITTTTKNHLLVAQWGRSSSLSLASVCAGEICYQAVASSVWRKLKEAEGLTCQSYPAWLEFTTPFQSICFCFCFCFPLLGKLPRMVALLHPQAGVPPESLWGGSLFYLRPASMCCLTYKFLISD